MEHLLVHLHRFSAVLEALYECQPPRALSPIELTSVHISNQCKSSGSLGATWLESSVMAT